MITIIMPYYDNPEMLARHYAEWDSWPNRVRAHFEWIIVDDGSPSSPAADVPGRPAGVSIYRVLEDKPWHQHGARNLGAHVAPEGWLLLTDMDHMLEMRPASLLVAALPKLRPGIAYMPQRIEASTRAVNPKRHPNTFLMTRELYWRLGGYDEDYCGVYGTDSLFRKRLPVIRHLDVPLVRYWREIVPDASTQTLPRKEGRAPGAKQAVLAMKQRLGRADKIVTLAFSWERVC